MMVLPCSEVGSSTPASLAPVDFAPLLTDEELQGSRHHVARGETPVRVRHACQLGRWLGTGREPSDLGAGTCAYLFVVSQATVEAYAKRIEAVCAAFDVSGAFRGRPSRWREQREPPPPCPSTPYSTAPVVATGSSAIAAAILSERMLFTLSVLAQPTYPRVRGCRPGRVGSLRCPAVRNFSLRSVWPLCGAKSLAWSLCVLRSMPPKTPGMGAARDGGARAGTADRL